MASDCVQAAHSQYIYPHQPFANLDDRMLQTQVREAEKRQISDISAMLDALPVEKCEVEGSTEFERVLSVFRSPQYLLGPQSYIDDHLDYWSTSFGYFIENSKRLEFCIMACPFKIPCPLKTERRTADLGEVLFLHRLKLVCERISEIYAPGARVTILAEGVFGEFIGLEPQEWAEYRVSIENLIKDLGFSEFLSVHNLDEIEERAPGFRAIWKDSYQKLKQDVAAKEPNALQEYEGAFESILRIVNTRMYARELLMEVYNFGLTDREISKEALEARQDILERTSEAVFQYRAFLKARDITEYVENLIPGCMKLTLSAKPKNLGIIPINHQTSILPYHGVGVVSTPSGSCGVNYLIDVLRERRPVKACFLEGDPEEKPFYFQIEE